MRACVCAAVDAAQSSTISLKIKQAPPKQRNTYTAKRTHTHTYVHARTASDKCKA